jgi:hypothetical protein
MKSVRLRQINGSDSRRITVNLFRHRDIQLLDRVSLMKMMFNARSRESKGQNEAFYEDH